MSGIVRDKCHLAALFAPKGFAEDENLSLSAVRLLAKHEEFQPEWPEHLFRGDFLTKFFRPGRLLRPIATFSCDAGLGDNCQGAVIELWPPTAMDQLLGDQNEPGITQ